MNIGLENFVLITFVLAVGAALQGSIGYGMGMLAAPVLVLVEPRFIPGPFLLAALVLVVLMVIRERQAVDLFGLRWVMLGSVPATLLGAALLSSLAQPVINIVFGVIILAAVVMSLGGVRFPQYRWVLICAGVLSGFMGVIGAIGGPPIALVYQDSSIERLRATMSGYFIVGTLITLASLIPVGRFGTPEANLALLQIPGIVIGYLVSLKLGRILKGGSVRYAILGISAISGLVVILKQVF
jgi:hypothetical protein